MSYNRWVLRHIRHLIRRRKKISLMRFDLPISSDCHLLSFEDLEYFYGIFTNSV